MEYVMPVAVHNALVEAAYRQRGFTPEECAVAAKVSESAAWHGIKTHNALKALHLDDHFGSGNKTSPGCVPGATIIHRPCKFEASQKWNAQKKLGQAVAVEAMDTCTRLADKYGIGQVSVDHAFHYLWGGGYVMDAAKKGYIAYTNCTAALAEVVPFGGKFPTLGTNPHSWGFPTTDAVGFPIVIDWATSTIAMGRVQQFKREGKQLPPGCAVDKDGKETTDPNQVSALIPFGAHKGYGMSLINEVIGAFIGGSLPTIRSRPEAAAKLGPGGTEKTTPNFYFQIIHPEALSCGHFAKGRDQQANVKAVLEDILGHGNKETGKCILPGELEHNNAMRSEKAGGLLFTEAEIGEFAQIAEQTGAALDKGSLKQVN
ncbi:MAG: Ldh family oxidoreductase [Phycisphaeraceae bacterium]